MDYHSFGDDCTKHGTNGVLVWDRSDGASEVSRTIHVGIVHLIRRRVLEAVLAERAKPEAIVVDNGPEFRGRALAGWSEERRVRLQFIEPGKPSQSCFIESFNGRLREECLTLDSARDPIAVLRCHSNYQRLYLRRSRRSPRAAPRAAITFMGHEFPMPSQQGFRRDDRGDLGKDLSR